jgi:hypothetical protein
VADLSFVAGDDQPSIFGTLAVNGTVLDLTSASEVRFQMRPANDRRLSVDAEATVVTAPLGAVRYDWAEGDLLTAGNYVMRWQVEWGDGSIQHSDPENTISVGSE